MRALALSLLLLLACSASPIAAPQSGPTLTAVNYHFEPQTLEVDPGANVTVVVQGEGHTVTSVDGLWDTGLKQGGETTGFTAPTTPGTYKFYCRLHANPTDPVDASHMTGILVVRGPGNATTSTPASTAAPSTTPSSSTPASTTSSSPPARTPGFGAALLVGAALLALAVRRR